VTPRRASPGAAILIAFALLAIAPLRSAAAQAQAADEYALKAAFLYNFTRFVEWPDDAFESADSPFRICVVGSDPFGTQIDTLTRRRVGTRAIAVERAVGIGQLSRCQIAYFDEGSRADFTESANGIEAPRTTLTVASGRGFARDGGMVGLVTGRGRVQLHVNLAAIQRSPLKFSAKLLEVAEVRHSRLRVRE
jgi:hypothetical protein